MATSELLGQSNMKAAMLKRIHPSGVHMQSAGPRVALPPVTSQASRRTSKHPLFRGSPVNHYSQCSRSVGNQDQQPISRNPSTASAYVPVGLDPGSQCGWYSRSSASLAALCTSVPIIVQWNVMKGRLHLCHPGQRWSFIQHDSHQDLSPGCVPARDLTLRQIRNEQYDQTQCRDDSSGGCCKVGDEPR